MKRLIKIHLILLFCFILNNSFSQSECRRITADDFDVCSEGADMKIIDNVCDAGNIYLVMSPTPVSPMPFCGDNAILNNPSYFSFVADGTAPFGVIITPIQGTCTNVGGSAGIQAALAGEGDCSVEVPYSIPCHTDCSVSPLFLETKFVPAEGQVIVLILDGCNGSVCDVNLNIVSGWKSNEVEYPDNELLEESVIELEGSEDCGWYTLTVEPPFEGLCDYRWSFPDGSIQYAHSNRITVDVSTFPDGLICVQGYAEECFPGEFFPAPHSVCYDFSSKEFPEIVVIGQATTCGTANGSAVAEVTGGELFHYLWSNGSTDSMISNVEAGWYRITVTDVLGCIYTDSVFIAPSEQIEAIAEVIEPDCSGNPGEILLQVFGGSGTYTYTWFPDISTGSFAGELAGGRYGITVSDFNDPSCFQEVEIELAPHGELPVDIVEIISAQGQEHTGSATIFVQGAGEYTYELEGPGGMSVSGTFSDNTVLLSELGAGHYSLAVTDIETGCTGTIEFEIEMITSAVTRHISRVGELLVFPNPVAHTLSFDSDRTGESYEIISLEGKVISGGKVEGTRLDVNSLANGVYILRVEDIKGEQKFAKLVKVN